MTELITNITYYLISELVPNITFYLISEPVPNITNYLISEPVPDSLRESFLTYASFDHKWGGRTEVSMEWFKIYINICI